MEAPSAQCPDRAVNKVTICFLIDTDSLPPILVGVQFHGGRNMFGKDFDVEVELFISPCWCGCSAG